MFPIRRRWPILTGLIAAVLYMVNYYRISGFEHLRLEPISASPGQAGNSAPDLSMGIPSITDGSPPKDVYGHGHRTVAGVTAKYHPAEYGIQKSELPPVVGAAAADQISWPSQLHSSEKFSLLEEQLQNGAPADSWPASGRPTLPVSKPIPPPASFDSQTPSPLVNNPQGVSATPRTGIGLPPAVAGGAMAAIENPFSKGPLTRPQGTPSTGFMASRPAPGGRSSTGGRIRIASFNTQALGPAKLNKPHVISLLVSLLRQYDVVALQEVYSTRDDILPLLVERLNQSGRTYDYMVGPRVGRGNSHEQFAFVFDTARLETDRYRLYTVDDPQDLLTYEPLVAWFRCKEASEKEAFTFSLINTKINPLMAQAERDILPDLVDAVQADGRNEDDWIVLGDLAGGNAQLAILERVGVRFAVRDIPTEVTGTKMLDGLMFSAHATTEFTGRSGALDFLRKHNLSIEQAMEISSHLPVWAEFSVYEGAVPGRIAPGLTPPR